MINNDVKKLKDELQNKKELSLKDINKIYKQIEMDYNLKIKQLRNEREDVLLELRYMKKKIHEKNYIKKHPNILR